MVYVGIRFWYPSPRRMESWSNEFSTINLQKVGRRTRPTLMSWTMASAKLNDNQTRIRGSDVSGPPVRGGQTCIN